MTNNNDNVQDIYEELRTSGFKTSKQIIAFQNSELLVDDVNKKFAVIDNLGSHIFNYADLLSFEYDEYCQPVTSDNTNLTCLYIKIRLLLNNLNKPQIEIACLPATCLKSSTMYEDAKQISTEISATLNYILNYNKQQFNNSANQTEPKLVNGQIPGNAAEFSKNAPTQQTTPMQRSNYEKKSNKGLMIFIIILLICLAIIAAKFVSNLSNSDNANTTIEANEVTDNTENAEETKETENMEETAEASEDDLKEFDQKSWDQFVYIFKAHTDFAYNLSLYTDGVIPTEDFYNYCKEMEAYFENVVNVLDYGKTEDEKAYLDKFKSIVSDDKQAAENLINYMDSDKEEYLSKAQENIESADVILLNIANIRADLLEKAGYTNEEIDEIIYSIRDDLMNISN